MPVKAVSRLLGLELKPYSLHSSLLGWRGLSASHPQRAFVILSPPLGIQGGSGDFLVLCKSEAASLRLSQGNYMGDAPLSSVSRP